MNSLLASVREDAETVKALVDYDLGRTEWEDLTEAIVSVAVRELAKRVRGDGLAAESAHTTAGDDYYRACMTVADFVETLL